MDMKRYIVPLRGMAGQEKRYATRAKNGRRQRARVGATHLRNSYVQNVERKYIWPGCENRYL